MRLAGDSVLPFVSLTTQIVIDLRGRASAETFQRKNLIEAHHLFWSSFLFDNRNRDSRSGIHAGPQILGKFRRRIMLASDPVHGAPPSDRDSTTDLSKRLARIERVARRFANENQQRQHDRDREKPGEAK